jgi:hypothetical protein
MIFEKLVEEIIEERKLNIEIPKFVF